MGEYHKAGVAQGYHPGGDREGWKEVSTVVSSLFTACLINDSPLLSLYYKCRPGVAVFIILKTVSVQLVAFLSLM